MNYMLAGLILFFGPHLLPTLPKFRAMKVKFLGESGYKGAFTLFSIAGLGLLAYGKSEIGFHFLYSTIDSVRPFMPLIMWASFFLLASAHRRSNVKRYTAHPMLWGIILWSVGHLLVNGDLGSVILFGSFLVYSLIDIYSANRRGAKKNTAKVAWKVDLMVLVTTLVLTLVVFYRPLV